MARKPEENKGGAGPAETKENPPAPLQVPAPTYEERARRGGHFNPSFPHPYGRQLPDLGEVPEVAEG